MRLDKILFLVEKNRKVLVLLFFLVYLCVGICAFKDYGISWDEGIQRRLGESTYNYIAAGDKTLFTRPNRYYGPAFQLFLFAAEKALNLETARSIVLARHFLTFLFFYAGVFFFYLLCKYRFKSWKTGLLGSLFLVLSPRIFAHSFYNGKDIAFLSMFIVCIYTLLRYLDKKDFLWAGVHALACAFLIDIRILGIFVFIFTVFFLVFDIAADKGREIKARAAAGSFVFYTVLLVFFVVLFWPLLWANPLARLKEVIDLLSRYSYPFPVLYFGEYYKAAELPWHYLPVWIGISTPPVYLILFFCGCVVLAADLFKKKLARFYPARRQDLVFASWFFAPLIAVFALKPSLYDGWRHMFYIYPGLLALSVTGLMSLFEFIKARFKGIDKIVARIILSLAVALSLINTCWFMARFHPFQNVYFNTFAGGDPGAIRNNFDMDYWGTSYKQALEYILQNDPDDAIKINVANRPGMSNVNILPPEDRERLVYVDTPEEADYFLGNYRWHAKDYPFDDKFYSIKVNDLEIMVVYKLK